MNSPLTIAVTGAFGYSGRYIAGHLLRQGHHVMTLTNSLDRPNPFGERVRAAPFNFDAPDQLRASLRGVDALINTYWVRFDHRDFNHGEAVRNTQVMFEAARSAGVKRIVHVSITNPDAQSPLPYFRGKAELEQSLQNLGLSWCILRPTVLFGREDVLINNIAWGLRHLPVFGVFGDGQYRLQPIYVDDLATAAAAAAAGRNNEIVHAIGPETFSYRGLVEMIRAKLGLRTPVVSFPPTPALWAGRLMGWMLKDVLITREEIQGLMEERLYVNAPPLGATRLTDWVEEHRANLGRRYTSELARRINRCSAYGSN